MLNPSKADERSNDPTIARCEKRARLQGFGGIQIVKDKAAKAFFDPAVKAAPTVVNHAAEHGG